MGSSDKGGGHSLHEELLKRPPLLSDEQLVKSTPGICILLLITRIPAPTLGPVVLHSLIIVVLVFVSLFYFVPLAVHAVAYR